MKPVRSSVQADYIIGDSQQSSSTQSGDTKQLSVKVANVA
jgi:hypothetical protein